MLLAVVAAEEDLRSGWVTEAVGDLKTTLGAAVGTVSEDAPLTAMIIRQVYESGFSVVQKSGGAGPGAGVRWW